MGIFARGRSKWVIVFLIVVIVLSYKMLFVADHCIGLLSKEAEKLGEKSAAIFLIDTPNIGCKSCSIYFKLRESSRKMCFLVAGDYSQNDIVNLRSAFKIRENDIVRKMTPFWSKIFRNCNSQIKSNILVLIDNSGHAEEVRRF